MTPRIGVVTFPGTLDDQDARRAVRLAGAEPVQLWHQDTDLTGLDAVVLAGGFSYGDYLRCGAIARFAPVMSEILDLAGKGWPILGICNGFQVLTEAHLLEGALMRNEKQKFICRDQLLRIENNRTAWTNLYAEGEEIVIPVKHGEGNFRAAPETVKRLESEGQVVFRYVGKQGNPNGSLHDIAGICNPQGNVVGLMPHPEHAIEPGFGPEVGGQPHLGVDGLKFFTSAINAVLARA